MKCLIPCSAYSVGKAETWLNAQAEKGRYLKKWGNLFVTFEKEEKFGYQYRLDLDDGKREPNWTRKTENEKAGWSYVTSMPVPYIHIYRARAGEAPLEPDPWHQNFAADKIRNSLIVTGLIFLLGAGLLLWLGFLTPWHFLNVMQKGWAIILRILIIYPLFFSSICTDMIPMIRLAWTLTRRPEQLHEQQMPWKPELYGIVWAAELLCLILLWGFSLFGAREPYGENLSEAGETVGYADLLEIENDGFEISAAHQKSGQEVNAVGRLVKIPTLFAREHYETIQYGTYEYAYGNSSGEERSGGASMNGEYWLMSSEKASQRLFNELVERYIQYEWYSSSLLRGYEKVDPGVWKVETVSDPRFKQLVTAKGAEWDFRRDRTLIFAQTGDWVIYLVYEGKADAGQVIEELCSAFGF